MKVLVAHPAQQHSYRLACALKNADMLSKYATTVYYKKRSLTYLVSKILKGNFKVKAQGRRCEELKDNEVIQFSEGKGLLKLLALNTRFLKKHYSSLKYSTADSFAKKAAEYAIKHKVDAVVTYDNTSPLLFEILKDKAPDILRILDVSAANPFYMRGIYEKDFELAPAFKDRLIRERRLVWDEEITSRTKREYELAQEFLVPSLFVAKTLEYSGLNTDKMHICPYGVDLKAFSPKEYDDVKNRPVEFIYVGGVKELKGIYYLLEAFKSIPKDRARLTVVGKVNKNDEDIKPYLDYVNFTGLVLHSDMPRLLRKSDVFILPSLGEGLSLSVLEAASCGLPFIISENCGVDEGMLSGNEGFIVPIQSVDAIKEKALWFCDNPESLSKMGKSAAEFAAKYSWGDYSESIQTIFTKF